MIKDETSHWYHFDLETYRFVFTETEDHIYAPGTKAQQRIGDMDREGLLMVIATGYEDRENLALALIAVTSNKVYLTEKAIESTKRLAQIIVDRVWRDHKGLANGG